MASLAGKVCAVTGGSGGIGLAIVHTLLKYDCKVIGVGTKRGEPTLKDMARDLKGFEYRVTNLSDGEACEGLAELCGESDFLVNCAGIARISPMMQQTAEDFDLTMNVNTRATFLTSKSFARQWIESKKQGAIVNVSSQASMAPLPGHLTYCASKAASDMLTRMMAMELGPHSIRVNAVNPTVVLTDMGRANWSDPAVATPMLSSIPLHRFAEPEECSEVVAWLLSDSAGMINGHMIPIDGGFLACRSNLMPQTLAA
eukprot:gene5916-9059_t